MLQSHSGNMSNMANISTSQTDTRIAISLYGLIWDAIFFFFKIYFMAFVPLIDSAVKSGTGNERERSGAGEWTGEMTLGRIRTRVLHGPQARMWSGLLFAPQWPPSLTVLQIGTESCM